MYDPNTQEEINVAQRILVRLELNKAKCQDGSSCISRYDEMISFLNRTYIANANLSH
ncbi:MAG: hypothetical protein ACI83W_000400 [Marinoscillum sp.]|jgi:hypothetical protein